VCQGGDARAGSGGVRCRAAAEITGDGPKWFPATVLRGENAYV
jgi:hypothetical protein